jgi:hypothetical protein
MTAYTMASASFTRKGVPANRARCATITRSITFATEAAAQGISDFSGSDTLKIAIIPAGCWVRNVAVSCDVAAGATCTMDTGDSGSATQFLSNTNMNSVAITAAAASTNKFYSSADYISLTLDHAAALAKGTWSFTLEDSGLVAL